MQLWFYKAQYGNWQDKLISYWTFGQYSHVEIKFSKECFSSSLRDNGVRYKNIKLTEKWDVFDIGNEDKEEVILKWANKQLGKPYDLLGVLGLGIGFAELGDRKRWYCSEIVSFILNKFNILKLPIKISPNKLATKLYGIPTSI